MNQKTIGNKIINYLVKSTNQSKIDHLFSIKIAQEPNNKQSDNSELLERFYKKDTSEIVSPFNESLI